MLGVAPFVAVVVAEEPGSVAESPVELGKESLKPFAGLLFQKTGESSRKMTGFPRFS